MSAASFLQASTVSLRNILRIEGFQENPLLGYGVVVGLKGTGDSDSGTQTREIISRIANNFGFKIDSDKIKPKNSAVVLVSATITPFSQQGTRIDVKVSSIYDAKSLEGGELVITPLMGGDNAIYAVAEGSVMIDRFSRGIIGFIPQGAIMQKRIDDIILDTNSNITFIVQESLGYDAFTKSADAIRQKFPDSVRDITFNRIKVALPQDREINSFIDDIFKLSADIEEEPSVLVDAKSGILISGGNVIISDSAISYGGMDLNIGQQKNQGGVKLLKGSATVQDLVESLNQTGFTGSDIIKILQLLYKNGNLKARLIVQ
jgi:flagellar P-ring protein precursor FlgI